MDPTDSITSSSFHDSLADNPNPPPGGQGSHNDHAMNTGDPSFTTARSDFPFATTPSIGSALPSSTASSSTSATILEEIADRDRAFRLRFCRLQREVLQEEVRTMREKMDKMRSRDIQLRDRFLQLKEKCRQRPDDEEDEEPVEIVDVRMEEDQIQQREHLGFPSLNRQYKSPGEAPSVPATIPLPTDILDMSSVGNRSFPEVHKLSFMSAITSADNSVLSTADTSKASLSTIIGERTFGEATVEEESMAIDSTPDQMMPKSIRSRGTSRDRRRHSTTRRESASFSPYRHRYTSPTKKSSTRMKSTSSSPSSVPSPQRYNHFGVKGRSPLTRGRTIFIKTPTQQPQSSSRTNIKTPKYQHQLELSEAHQRQSGLSAPPPESSKPSRRPLWGGVIGNIKKHKAPSSTKTVSTHKSTGCLVVTPGLLARTRSAHNLSNSARSSSFNINTVCRDEDDPNLLRISTSSHLPRLTNSFSSFTQVNTTTSHNTTKWSLFDASHHNHKENRYNKAKREAVDAKPRKLKKSRSGNKIVPVSK